MKEWYVIQFKLEKILEEIIIKYSDDEEAKELGDYLMSNILICKEVAEQKEHQDELWLNLKDDLNSIVEMSSEFLKEKFEKNA